MPREMFDSEYLYGIHDPGGEHLMLNTGKPGWVLFTEGIGCDPNDGSGRAYDQWANQGLGIMARLNNGYGGKGAIPYRDQYASFARRCANYVRASSGCRIWIIGNEPNHPDDRPKDRGVEEIISPEMFAECYRLCRNEIRKVDPKAQVLVGAPAAYIVVDGIDHVEYLRRVLAALGRDNCDGFTLHAYTHGANADFIDSPKKMDSLPKCHWHFRVYQDFLNVVPENMRDLPCYITETNQTIEGNGPVRGWDNENRQWVQRAYGEIDWWNKQPGNQVIRALILYRWSRDHAGFSLDGLAGIHEDFKQALNFGYKWPERQAPTDPLALLREKLAQLEAEIAELRARWQHLIAGGFKKLESDVKGIASQTAPVVAAATALVGAESEISRLERWPDGGGVQRPAIADLIASLPQHPTKSYADRDLSEIRHVIIHHSGMDATVGLNKICDVLVRKDLPGCPYHFWVDEDGAIAATQPLTKMVGQSNKKPEYNRSGIAVALVGNFSVAAPGAVQLDGAARLIAWLLDTYRLDAAAVLGRNEIEATQSPGTQWLAGAMYKNTLLALVQELLAQTPTPTPPIDDTDTARQLAALKLRVAELEAQLIEVQFGTGVKPIELMLLLWDHGKDWAIKDWLSAQAYIAAFRPVISFDPQAALAAKRVLIVGGEGGISKEAEQKLVQAGVQAARLAGLNEADTNARLAELMKSGQPWPGAAVAGVDLAELELEDAILAASPPLPRKPRRRSTRRSQGASSPGAAP